MSELERIGKLSHGPPGLPEVPSPAGRDPGAAEPAIPRRKPGRPAPATFAQRRLWFLDQLQPGSAIHHIGMAFRVQGDLEVGALQRSLSEVVRRHEALRTTFKAREGQPTQMIQPAVSVALPVIEVGGSSEPEREREAVRLAEAEAEIPFDLSMGPLFRAKLLRLGQQKHVLLLTAHQIVSDTWSKGILFRELALLYEAFSQEKPSPLSELPRQYVDYAAWHLESMDGEVLGSQLSYWKSQLRAIPPSLELPTDRPRPAVQTFRGGQRPLLLSGTLVDELEAVGRREGTTLFMALLAALDVLLWRYTGQKDFTVGTPITGRASMETEGLVGLFANTLVLRADLSGDPTLRELLARVRGVTLGAYEHPDLPFEKLVEELNPERNLSHTPLFQVMFTLEKAATDELQLPGLNVIPFPSARHSAMFDLTLSVAQTDSGLLVRLEYNSDLFDASTIDRMLEQLRGVLEGIATDAGRRLSELPLLTEAERHRMLVEWNATEADSEPRCIHQLFEEQAERTPDAVAVEFGERSLSYRELDRRATQLARHLRSMGVGPEVLVGICVERSVEMVVGLLGVLKAGGAYVPLDPAYPKERLAFMLGDAKVTVLLTQDRLLGALPLHQATVLRLDADWERVGRESEAGPGTTAKPAHSAYVIYTSGSTGRPKGVVVTHRSVVNLLESMREETGLGAEDSLLAVTSLSFDIAALELFLPLCVGARLVIADREAVLDGSVLTEVLTHAGVTVMQATPATWELLLRAGWRGQEGLKALCGGEALPQPLAESLLDRCGCLWNLYGPTETTIWSAAHRVTREDHPISIGRPIANTRIYILDAGLQPVPVGVPGELHIGGDGLARGYRERPTLTAERFIPEPFGGSAGGRLYKTGDRARYRPDGSIEFLGRTDHQVKVRGFRIELAEIETVLRQHPGVREAVVLAREDLPGEKRLVAYLVGTGRPEPNAGQLRAFLKRLMPEYMVPSAFVSLEALPLTPNGKVDRRALPAPDEKRPELEASYLAPRDDLERQIANVWQRVLGIQAVGVRDDFFELGGHSFLAVRLVRELQKNFGRNLPLATLFQAPTVAQLAEIFRDENWAASWSPLVALRREGSRPPLFLAHPAGGNVLGYADLARLLGPDQPVYALQARGLDGREQPLTRIEDMAARYVPEIRAVQPEGPYFLAGASFGGKVVFEMARELDGLGQSVGFVGVFDTIAPGALESLPRIVRVRSRLRVEAMRFGHLFRILLRPGRWSHVKKKSALWVQKIRRQLGEDFPSAEPGTEEPLPRALRNVRAACELASRRYAPGPYRGRMTVFRAHLRPPLDVPDEDLGWGKLALGGVEVKHVPGDHLSLYVEPQVQVLAGELRDCLDRAAQMAEAREARADRIRASA